MAKDKRIVVEVDDELRRLISLTQTVSGDVNLAVRKGVGYAPYSNIVEGKALDIRNDYYSLHCSNLSKIGVNQIHLTKELSDGTALEAFTNTTAIKTHDKWCPLFIEHCSDLSKPQHVPRRVRSVESIGVYNPRSYSLAYGILLGRSGRRISNHVQQGLPPYLSTMHVDISMFCLLVFWTFITDASMERGNFVHFSSTGLKKRVRPLRSTHNQNGHLIEGYDDEQAAKFMIASAAAMKTWHFHELLNCCPSVDEFAARAAALGFHKEGR